MVAREAGSTCGHRARLSPTLSHSFAWDDDHTRCKLEALLGLPEWLAETDRQKETVCRSDSSRFPRVRSRLDLRDASFEHRIGHRKLVDNAFQVKVHARLSLSSRSPAYREGNRIWLNQTQRRRRWIGQKILVSNPVASRSEDI